MSTEKNYQWLVISALAIILLSSGDTLADNPGRIQPFHQNPAYW